MPATFDALARGVTRIEIRAFSVVSATGKDYGRGPAMLDIWAILLTLNGQPLAIQKD